MDSRSRVPARDKALNRRPWYLALAVIVIALGSTRCGFGCCDECPSPKLHLQLFHASSGDPIDIAITVTDSGRPGWSMECRTECVLALPYQGQGSISFSPSGSLNAGFSYEFREEAGSCCAHLLINGGEVSPQERAAWPVSLHTDGRVLCEGDGSCDDGRSCTDIDRCFDGRCIGQAVADGTACDDGDDETFDDVCHGGACWGTRPDPPGPDAGPTDVLVGD